MPHYLTCRRLVGFLAFALGAAFTVRAQTPSRSDTSSLPHFIQENGRHALMVDGAPFLVLGGQSHNSSAWGATMPAVWTAIDQMHANTLEVPISWEQFEPQAGHFDTTIVDLLLEQARQHHIRLVLLWFGTWKNGSAHYLPLWMKAEPDKYPRVVGRDGRRVDSPSPHAPALLAADVRAFSALMRHLKAADPQHTVIMMQVENEPGTWNSVRDFSPAAEKLFSAPVPPELLQALGLTARAGQAWPAVFGGNADEFFHAWSVGHFIGQVAAAGKAEYALPMYVNVALRDPLSQPAAGSYESGGATDNVLDIWKAAAPAIDVLAPDIYLPDTPRYSKVLELYNRPDNALFVPETIGSAVVSRDFYSTLAAGGIGWAPFGIDGGRNAEASAPTQSGPAPLPATYQVVGANMREFARLAFEHRLHAAVEEKDSISQTMKLGRWNVTVSFGPPALGYGRNPAGNPEPIGRALIAQLGENEFLVTAYLARVEFKAVDASAQREFLRVDEGGYESGTFCASRIWNGDETDWGLNFGTTPQLLHVLLGTY